MMANDVREVPLTRSRIALVDAEDYERVMRAGCWQANPHGRTCYARKTLRVDGRPRTVGMHQFITGWSFVDHVNGDGLENTRANLRRATRGQNMANRRLGRNNTSGFKGVGLHRATSRWQARIWCDNKFRSLGLYPSPEAAARAYDLAACELFGEFARLNFPPGVTK